MEGRWPRREIEKLDDLREEQADIGEECSLRDDRVEHPVRCSMTLRWWSFG